VPVEKEGGAAPTLRKYFADELATAHVKANARVSETAYNMAISGKCPAATFFGSSAAPDGERQCIWSIQAAGQVL
jgi:hypothetical protein